MKTLFDQIPLVHSIKDKKFIDYFNNPQESCIVQELHDTAFKPGLFHLAVFYSLADCLHKIKTITMIPFEVYELDLTEEIQGGELLYINYMPYGVELIPVEMHSNIPTKKQKSNEIYIYPVHAKPDPKPTKVDILYWYAPESVKDDIASNLLIEAFKYYYSDDYSNMVVSIQTALEIRQYDFLSKAFKKYDIPSSDYELFLTKGMPFFSQFKNLVPFVCNISKTPLIPKSISKDIKTLIAHRNTIIHSQRKKPQFDKDSAKSMLISAFLLYKYYQIFSKE